MIVGVLRAWLYSQFAWPRAFVFIAVAAVLGTLCYVALAHPRGKPQFVQERS